MQRMTDRRVKLEETLQESREPVENYKLELEDKLEQRIRDWIATRKDWQTLAISRQRSTEERLDATIRHGMGTLRLGPSDGPLYTMQMRYDATYFDPLTVHEGSTLELGLRERDGAPFRRGSDWESASLQVGLSHALPLALLLEFGAGRAEVDLGGLRLTDLDIRTGASETRIEVTRPNPVRLASAALAVGATAIGTKVNTPEGYSEVAVRKLAEVSGLPVVPAENLKGLVAIRRALQPLKPDFGLLLTNTTHSWLTFRFAGVSRVYGYRRNLRRFFLAGGPIPQKLGKRYKPLPMQDYYLELCRYLQLQIPEKPRSTLYLSQALQEQGTRRLQAPGAAAGGNHAPAGIEEAGDGGGAESGGGAGDQDGLVHPASLAVHLAWAAQGRPTER